MRQVRFCLIWTPVIAGTLVLCLGVYHGLPWIVGVGLAAVAYSLGKIIRERGSPNKNDPPPITPRSQTLADVPPTRSGYHQAETTDLGMLIEEMLAHGRYALLLRPQIIGNLSASQRERTHAALAEGMAVVPAGEVVLGDFDTSLDDGRFTDDEVDRNRYARVAVEDFFLDRYPVTNRQYYQFVASGGYEQMSLWDPSILAALLDFVDETGCPGPRFWQAGRYPREEDDYPVVGISWYEAAAFARWAGKRLSTDAEWVKAASWPVLIAPGVWQQRKFPWGNGMDHHRANLWGTGPGRTAPIGQHPNGCSVGGVYQLVGNVWEWTTGDFGYDDIEGPLLADPSGMAVMKSLRGGAFDTYFDSQATCQFHSGDHPLARKHNVGFRCALSACDLGQRSEETRVTDPQTAELAEVGA